MRAASNSVTRHCLDCRPCALLRRPAAVLRSGRSGWRAAPVVRVVSRYTGAGGGSGGGGGPPPPPAVPQQQQQQQQMPQQQQAGPPMQRAATPARRRVGVSMPPQNAAPTFQNTLQKLSAAAPLVPVKQDPTLREVQRAPLAADASDITLPRSLIMDKEVITRTSGKRLGYINQLFVDPSSLAVVSLYLRQSPSSLAASSTEHVRLYSLCQIADVALVHDERALMDPPADDSLGYCKLVGAEVVTQAGKQLGRVRDFLFNPDDGTVSTIKYDTLGIPSIPQALFSCYSLSWEDVTAVGPTRVIVKTGSEGRAIKENDGVVDEGLSLLVDILMGPGRQGKEGLGQEQQGKLAAASAGTEMYRTDLAYAQWYAEHGQSFQDGPDKPLPPAAEAVEALKKKKQQEAQMAQQQQQQQQRRALPAPTSTSYAQALQPQQQQRQPQQPPPQQQQSYQQQLVQQQQRQAVPAGGGGGGGAGWGSAPSPPPAQQQQYAYPPTTSQQQPAPQGPQYGQQQRPVQPQQQYRAPPAAPGSRLPPGAQQQGPPGAQQQQYQQQPQQAAGAAPRMPPQQQQQRPAAQPQQPPLPQNGIPIIDRTPLPPFRRRDADGNYGPPPTVQQQQASQQRQQQGPSQQQQQAQPPPAGRQQQAPRAASAPPQVVEPDAVIPGGSYQQQLRGSGGGGGRTAAMGMTQIAEYRQL